MISEDLRLDQVSVGIIIESTRLTPEEISQRVGIVWDEVHRIGDARGHTGKKWQCNVWCIFERRHGAVNTGAHALLPVCIADVVNRLAPISEGLREISDADGAEFFIHVTAQSVPGISLPRDTLLALANARLSLDVDIVLYAAEEDLGRDNRAIDD